MTVLKRGKSRHWYIQFQIGGQTVVRSSRTTSKKVAEQMEAQLRAEIHAERYLGRKRSISLADALSQFIASKAGTPNYRNLQAHSRTILRHLAGSRSLDALSTRDIEEFKSDRIAGGTGPQTVKHGLNAIRCTIEHAKRRGFRVPEIVFPTVSIPKSRVRYLSAAEEEVLLRELDPKREGRGLAPYDRRSPSIIAAMQDACDLIVVLLDTGARYGEIAGLEWSQIDLSSGSIRLWRRKVRNEGIIFMTARVFEILERRSRTTNSPFVFKNKSGGARGYTYMTLRKALNRAGLRDCSVHTLRHTHATRLIQNGLTVYEVQAVLGHSDPKTTMRYAHLEAAKVTAKARDVIERLNAAKTSA